MEVHPEIQEQELFGDNESCFNFWGDLFSLCKTAYIDANKRLNSELKSDDQMFGHGHGTVSIWSCRVCTLLLLSYPVKHTDLNMTGVSLDLE